MDLGANADGELLQRALEGEVVNEPGILELVAVLHAVQAVDQAGLAPRAEFVSDLRARLLADEPATLPAVPVMTPEPDESRDARAPVEPDRSTEGGTVSVLRIARPLKLVAAAAAALLLIGGALGAASRSAVPGDVLYPVKQLLDRAAVQLAGSSYDEGLTYLAQAQEHIGDARALLDGGSPSPENLDTAYDAATDATRSAQAMLVGAYHADGRTEALTELADFYTRAIPQVDAMRPRTPAGSLPAWQRLRDALGSGQVATLRELATCGACGDRAAQARAALAGLAGVAGATLSGTPSAAAPGIRPPGPARTSAPALKASATAPGGVPLPGGSTTAVPLPGGAVNLPSIGVSGSSVGVGGGGVTLPGATLPLPHVGVTSSTLQVVVPPPTLSTPSLSILPSLPATVSLSPPLTLPGLP